MAVSLDLYNFDGPEAEGSRYVLTSPRSLEACSRLNIKPVQLLHKPLEDFSEENCGKSTEFIEILHNDWEEKRTAKLERCRKEREKIIMEQQVAKKRGKEKFQFKSKAVKDDIHLEDVEDSTLKNSYQHSKYAKDSYTKLGSKISKNESVKKTESIFSKRFGSIDRSVPLIATHPPPRGATPSDESISGILNDDQLFGSTRVERSRTRTNNDISRLRSKSLETQNRQEKLRYSSMSLRSSSVFDYHSRLASGYTTPQIQRDKRLTLIMKERRKKEETEEKERQRKMLEWNEEKRNIEEAKRKEQVQRNKELASSQLQWEKKLKGGELKRIKEEKVVEQERLRDQEHVDSVVKSNKEKQEKLRQRQVEERRKIALEKKKQQEKTLNLVNKEVTAFQHATEQDITDRLQRAERLKLENEMKELEKIKLMNKKQRERFAEIQEEVRRRNREEARMKKEALEEKLTKAERNYKQKLLDREATMRNQGQMINSKILQTRQNQKKIDVETEEHMRSIAEHKDELQRKAADIAMQNQHNKSIRAQKMRASSEEGWKKNLTLIQQKAEGQIKKTKDNCEMKENKAKRHLQLKEAAFEFSRFQAKMSEAERDVIKRKTSNFNQMAEKAKLMANVGHGPRSSFVNYSTVKLG
ncbi:unnamed protein product [Clavelina lepadiformis]|uniref:Coiled-coil domain-containing protein 177 n=1 Tax=Clavelina lepadiformis TaxID=159417 RepID=A0ABP0FHS8_CLALP